MITAGNDTTVTMMVGGTWALLQHPDQLAELRADPSLIPAGGRGDPALAQPAALLPAHRLARTSSSAVSRSRPARRWRCTTRRPTATRRSSTDSQDFDIHRNPNPQLSFGIGEHFCLGVHLARLEGRVFFEELLAAFPKIELTGEPKRTRSNLNNAFKSMPMRLGAG